MQTSRSAATTTAAIAIATPAMTRRQASRDLSAGRATDRTHPRAEPNSTASLAIGRWDGRPALAMRWNGTDDEPLGNPQSRGLPTWFIVPDQYVDPILEKSGFSDSKLEFARDFLELRRVYFLTRCPTAGRSNFGELVLASYRSEALPQLMEKLDRGVLKFYCIFCDQQWPPTPDEKERLKSDMEAGWDAYCKRGAG